MSASSPRPKTGQRSATDTPRSPTTAEPPAAMAALPAKLLVTATQAACYLSVSRAHIYRLLQAGELRSVHTKGAMRIPVSELTSYVDRLLQAATDGDVKSC
ncbi:MAG TPA: helix-turn-helix domain-containing protein [Ktedonobacterales bacterium]